MSVLGRVVVLPVSRIGAKVSCVWILRFRRTGAVRFILGLAWRTGDDI
jgi:hypothetical protein